MYSSATVSWQVPFADDGGAEGSSGLDGWPVNHRAQIRGYGVTDGEEAERTRRRLAELGFLPGVVVQVTARGWLRGGPIVVRVGQSTFALRAHEAALLHVTPVRESTV